MTGVRFPRTPHLAWLGPGRPREDKLLLPEEVREFLANEIVVEEKIDGANVGIWLDEGGKRLLVKNRGTLLTREHAHPQFKGLFSWLAEHQDRFLRLLSGKLALFGEWCYAVHSVRYSRLPDWFLLFDVYDLVAGRFCSTERRTAVARSLGLSTVPILARGCFDLGALRALLGPSRFGDTPAEGLYLRLENREYLLERAKLVQPEFLEGIGEHWSRRQLETNRLAVGRSEKRSEKVV